jgi:hypothetical protein
MQYALEQILVGRELTESVRDQIFAYFLEDSALAKSPAGQARPAVKIHASAVAGPQSSIRLKAIRNLKNVNRLTSGQTLTVGNHLTTVYGSNGTGKTGYARLFGSMCFTRGSSEVLPDLAHPESASLPMTAEIELTSGVPFTHTIGTRLDLLSGLYVFDTSSVNAHLSKSNNISFTPAGLSCLRSLAALVSDLQTRLDALIKGKKAVNIFAGQFSEPSELSTVMASLSADSDLVKLKDFAKKSSLSNDRSAEIDTLIAQLHNDQTDSRKNQMVREINSIKDFGEFAKRLNDALSDEYHRKIVTAVESQIAAGKALADHSLEKFQNEELPVIGSVEWINFVRLAKDLADRQAELDHDQYPAHGDRCLLCQQELTAAARDLMHSIWQYADGNLQKASDQAASLVHQIENVLEGVLTDSKRHDHVRALIIEQDQEIGQAVLKWLDDGLQQLAVYKEAVQAKNIPHGAALMAPLDDIASLHIKRAERLESLAKTDSREEIAKLKFEQTTLLHCKILSEKIADISEFIENCRWVRNAEAAMPNTRPITEQYNKMFNELVTEHYVATFQGYVSRFLHESVKVTVKTKGAQGETVRQVVLEIAPKHKPDKVLSEGEQRAVALADFLTEVSLDPDCVGMVFDDPVTSYGLEWREVAAQVLTEEAKLRQVIVFTHDLAFLYWLTKAASSEGVECSSHWIQRAPDGRPGYIALDSGPVLEKSYRTSEKAQKHLDRALKTSDVDERQAFVLQGFTALRTSYEALIMYDLLQSSVVRFSERVSVDAFKKIKWNPKTVDEVTVRFERLCFLMEGHSHSDELNMGNPTAEKLKEEIAHFDRLKAQIKKDSKSEVGAFADSNTSVTVLEPTKLSVVKNEG